MCTIAASRRVGILVLVVAVAAPPARAIAQQAGENSAAAEELFREAKRLMKEGKYADACPKLEASERLDPGVGTLLNLGDCYEKIGRLASAWAVFREAASRAQADKDPAARKEAERRARILEPRLPRLTVRVATPVPGLVVTRDGSPLDEALYGTAAPVDPGEHRVEASAPGFAAWSATVKAAPGAPVVVEVPALEKVEKATTEVVPRPDTGPTPAPPAVAPPPPSTPETPRAGRGRRLLAFSVGGAGLAATAVGLTFAVLASSKWHDADPHCDEQTVCDPVGFDLARDANTYADVSTVLVAVGGAAAAAGVVLYLTAPRARPEAVSVAPGPGGLGLTVRGGF